LVEAGVLATLAIVLWKGVDQDAGKAALLLGSLLIGAVLALVGQIYQTGADTYELFASWALFILPWALLARFAPLWLLWLAIVNLAVTLYFRTFGGFIGFLFGDEEVAWVLFVLNTAALVTWEALARSGITWLQARWGARLLITASAACATSLALISIFGWRETQSVHALGWFAWMLACLFTYRVAIRDLYALAIGVLSAIVVTVAWLGRHMLSSGDAGAYLLIGLVVIAMSAAGGWWLRRVAMEERA
jgi:uncharacterized membrane protein